MHAKQIRGLLSSLKREDAERLSAMLDAVCAETKIREGQEWAERRQRSKQEKVLILRLLREADCAARAANDSDDLSRARQKHADALDRMRSRGKRPEEKMLRGDHEECWQAYQGVRRCIDGRFVWLADLHYGQLSGETAQVEHDASAGDDPWVVQNQIRDLQRRTRGSTLKEVQREDLRRRLESAWETTSFRIAEKKREGRRRYDEWQQRAIERIDRLRALVDKNGQVVRSQEANIQKLHGEIATAATPEHESRCQGWIEESEIRIRDIERTNRDLEAEIRSLRERLPS